MTLTSESNPMRVDWIAPGNTSPFAGRLGLTIAPGKRGTIYGRSHERDLKADLRAIQATGADLIVNLMEPDEGERWQMEAYDAEAQSAGLEVRRFAIPDGDIPKSGNDFATFTKELRAQLESGKTVVVHCLGGLGRSGTLAACLLIEQGVSAKSAIQQVRLCRPGAVENSVQENFVEQYARAREQ